MALDFISGLGGLGVVVVDGAVRETAEEGVGAASFEIGGLFPGGDGGGFWLLGGVVEEHDTPAFKGADYFVSSEREETFDCRG